MPAPFDLSVTDALLSTTRAVRRRLDLERPVEREVILDCIRLSQQAPTASNSQGWRWVIVTEPGLRKSLAELYRKIAITALRPGAAVISPRATARPSASTTPPPGSPSTCTRCRCS